ncbi:HEAT repeat domain-containing protein [Anaeromyxobacter sp. Fw109-5]|uniref:HEAT repeat domain-containing protein n=1 Tax=Anaeromyxobacter sp. (strain Fw109-5) TaxID=404589 RepID=UPI0000ED749B|nr:HEAT repeat domain-containing protein [Anaeromyxobacter sp. Fw109-5]ABS26377.1 PBS lyase HEAT domain protein repeat-containing protein [Anaeromyxobacter sp. Fw109-5]
MAGSRGASTVIAVGVAAVLAAGTACRRDAFPAVASVRVAEGALSEPMREAGLDATSLETSARTALSEAGFRQGKGDHAYRARVDVLGVRLAPDGFAGSAPRVEIAVELELAPSRPEAGDLVHETSTATATLAGRTPRDAWRTAFGLAVADAAKGLALGFAAEAKPLDALILDLGSQDARVRDHAIRVLAERRSPEAIPALLERLRDGDPDIVQRAVGALAQIGDPRAVGALIEVAQGGDPALTARIARIVGDIGGPEAEGYLLTLEAGHPDPAVRRAAREALADLSARAEAAEAQVSAKMRAP